MKTTVIYGPPGCAKTTELLRRVEEAKTRYKPSQVSFLSFTKAGAAEALKRLGISRSDKICTIHSLTYRLNGFSQQSVVDITKLRKFGDRIGFGFRGQNNDTGEQMEVGDQYLAVLSRAVNRMVDIRDEYYESDRPGNWSEFKFFCESYEKWKRGNGYVDFNDMLTKYVQNPVDHDASIIIIDEAQDLSKLQWAVIEKMMEFPYVNEVVMAGDDDQCLYSFAGAHSAGMVEFEEKYNAERIILNQSYRVPKLVHGLAQQVINVVNDRVDKEYFPMARDGSLKRISQITPGMLKHGDDVMVLCRNFVTKQEIENELIRMRVPYKNEGGLPGLYSTRVADAIRSFKKLEKGEAISQSEIDRMVQVADSRTARELSEKKFTELLKRGYMRSFKIPPQHVEFYRDADFSESPTIRLSTIHSAKGREAETVILHTGLTAKTIKGMDKDPDSEARVFYVGVTRAKENLIVLEGEDGYRL